MQQRMDTFFQEHEKELTFLEVDFNQINSGHKRGELIELPFLMEDFKAGYSEENSEIQLTTEGMIKGIGFLFGVDPEFHRNDEYKILLDSSGIDVSEYLLRLSNQYFDQGQKVKALVLLRGITIYRPDEVKSLFNYGISLLDIAESQNEEILREEMKQEAKIKLEMILKKDPEFALPCYHLGFLYKDENLFVKAQKIWEKGIELGLEGHLEEHTNTLLREIEDLVQYEQGYHYVLYGKSNEGLKKLRPLEERYPDWWNLLFFIGLALRQIQDYPAAITYFQKVIELEKKLADPYVEIGLSFAGMGEHEKSIEYLEKGMKMDPYSHEIPCNLAMVYLDKGDLKNARKFIDTSLALEPEDQVSLACEKQVEYYENQQTL